jgi:hypothetical protein
MNPMDRPDEWASHAPAYRFVDRWSIPAPIDRVHEAIGDVARSCMGDDPR